MWKLFNLPWLQWLIEMTNCVTSLGEIYFLVKPELRELDFLKIERNMILLTIFLVIMNQTKFPLFYCQKELIGSLIIFTSIWKKAKIYISAAVSYYMYICIVYIYVCIYMCIYYMYCMYIYVVSYYTRTTLHPPSRLYPINAGWQL